MATITTPYGTFTDRPFYSAQAQAADAAAMAQSVVVDPIILAAMNAARLPGGGWSIKDVQTNAAARSSYNEFAQNLAKQGLNLDALRTGAASGWSADDYAWAQEVTSAFSTWRASQDVYGAVTPDYAAIEAQARKILTEYPTQQAYLKAAQSADAAAIAQSDAATAAGPAQGAPAVPVGAVPGGTVMPAAPAHTFSVAGPEAAMPVAAGPAPAASAPIPVPSPVAAPASVAAAPSTTPAPVGASTVPATAAQSAYAAALAQLNASGQIPTGYSSPFQAGPQVGSADYTAGIPAVPGAPSPKPAMPAPSAPAWVPLAALAGLAFLLLRGKAHA